MANTKPADKAPEGQAETERAAAAAAGVQALTEPTLPPREARTEAELKYGTLNGHSPAETAKFDVTQDMLGGYVAVRKLDGAIIARGKSDAEAREAGYAGLDKEYAAQ